jgi:serine/threonine-protein kinase
MQDALKYLQAALGDRYRFEHVLGRGGMASVYLAEDLRHNRRVAVKMLHPELAATVGAERFLSEIKIAGSLSHPHILPVYSSGEVDGVLYYVMPHIQGGSLGTRIARGGALNAEEAVRLASEVTEALVYAHACGIIHRDIKPENILLQAGKALVADFGIARAIGNVTGITATGLVVGSPPYMSPEQSLGDPVDARSDIYAVGTVLYEMLAGKAPFEGPTLQTVLTKSLTEELPPLGNVRAGLPVGLESTVMRAMARNPDDRFQTATEFLEALRGAPNGVRDGATAAGGQRLTPSRVAALFGVAAAAALAAIYAVMKQIGLPPWTFALAAGLAAVGLLLLILTDQAERRPRAGAARSWIRRRLTRRRWAAGGVLALLAWAIMATAFVASGYDVPGASRAPRLAVMPFQNLGATEDAYVTDGITDEIRGKLAGLANVRVIARESSNEYGGSAKSPREIGRELGVDYLLTGTVRWTQEGDDDRLVDVAPELIDVRTGDIAWQQSLHSASTDVAWIQADIAVRLAEALDVALRAPTRR